MSAPKPCPITHSSREYADDGISLVHAEDGSRCHGTRGKILQIIPAVGWRSVYAHEQNGRAHTSESPLACFALVELCDGTREVTPFLANWDDIDRGDLCGNFLGILGPGEPTEEWVHREAEEYCERERARKGMPKATAP